MGGGPLFGKESEPPSDCETDRGERTQDEDTEPHTTEKPCFCLSCRRNRAAPPESTDNETEAEPETTDDEIGLAQRNPCNLQRPRSSVRAYGGTRGGFGFRPKFPPVSERDDGLGEGTLKDGGEGLTDALFGAQSPPSSLYTEGGFSSYLTDSMNESTPPTPCNSVQLSEGSLLRCSIFINRDPNLPLEPHAAPSAEPHQSTQAPLPPGLLKTPENQSQAESMNVESHVHDPHPTKTAYFESDTAIGSDNKEISGQDEEPHNSFCLVTAEDADNTPKGEISTGIGKITGKSDDVPEESRSDLSIKTAQAASNPNSIEVILGQSQCRKDSLVLEPQPLADGRLVKSHVDECDGAAIERPPTPPEVTRTSDATANIQSDTTVPKMEMVDVTHTTSAQSPIDDVKPAASATNAKGSNRATKKEKREISAESTPSKPVIPSSKPTEKPEAQPTETWSTEGKSGSSVLIIIIVLVVILVGGFFAFFPKEATPPVKPPTPVVQQKAPNSLVEKKNVEKPTTKPIRVPVSVATAAPVPPPIKSLEFSLATNQTVIAGDSGAILLANRNSFGLSASVSCRWSMEYKNGDGKVFAGQSLASVIQSSLQTNGCEGIFTKYVEPGYYTITLDAKDESTGSIGRKSVGISVLPYIVLGIDIGSSYTCAAVVEQTSDGVSVKAIPLGEMRYCIPSFVAIDTNCRLLVGVDAKMHSNGQPTAVAFDFKRLIGRSLTESDLAIITTTLPYKVSLGTDAPTTPLVSLRLLNASAPLPCHPGKELGTGMGGKCPNQWLDDGQLTVAPEQLTASLLSYVKKAAETTMGRPITDAVVTVPAAFNDAQRRATRLAAEVAGFSVKRILNEPTAAATAYRFFDGNVGFSEDKTLVVVFDFGGGTLDVSLVEVSKGHFRVVATSGDAQLGGFDIDKALAVLAKKKLRQANILDRLVHQGDMLDQQLMLLAEEAKVGLSTTSTSQHLSLPNKDGRESTVELKYAELEEVVRGLADRILQPLKDVLKDVPERLFIRAVLMVGGTSRIRAVQDLVHKYFSVDIPMGNLQGINPMLAVAHGAALTGYFIHKDRDKKSRLVSDITPFPIGVQVRKCPKEGQCEEHTVQQVREFQPIPCQQTEPYRRVSKSSSRASIKIVQENMATKETILLGHLNLSGFPEKAGATSEGSQSEEGELEVTMSVDADGILTVDAQALVGERDKKTYRYDFRAAAGVLTESQIEFTKTFLQGVSPDVPENNHLTGLGGQVTLYKVPTSDGEENFEWVLGGRKNDKHRHR